MARHRLGKGAKNKPLSLTAALFIGTKRLHVSRDRDRHGLVSGRDRPCHGRHPTTVHIHRLTRPNGKTERKSTESTKHTTK